MDYFDMSAGEIIASIMIDLCITVVFYLLVPLILVIKGEKYTESRIKKIAIINCMVVWLLFFIIKAVNSTTEVTAAGLLWGWVGYRILKKRCLIIEKESNCKIKKDRVDISVDDEKNAEGWEKRTTTHVCISSNDIEPFTPLGSNEFSGNDFLVNRHNETNSRTNKNQFAKESQTTENGAVVRNKTIIRCVQCDSEIPAASKFCQYCGQKQSIEEKTVHFCRECGNKLKAGYVFCNICGTKVNEK